MKNILFAFLCTVSTLLYSQNWCPSGAEWNYRYSSGDDNNGYINYKYTVDTIISGVGCKMLEKTRYSEYQFGPPQYWQHYTVVEPSCFTYESGDTIFFYSRTSSSWQPMYYFGAQVGDTIKILYRDNLIANNYENTITAIVNEIGIDTINNEYKKYYRVIFPECLTYMNSIRFTENLATNNNDLIPELGCRINESFAFLCSYKDSSFSLYPENAVCRFILNGVEELPQKDFRIYPNPANQTIVIEADNGLMASELLLNDLWGRNIKTFTINTAKTIIEVSQIPIGMYNMVLKHENGFLIYRKINIQH